VKNEMEEVRRKKKEGIYSKERRIYVKYMIERIENDKKKDKEGNGSRRR
jgi:hypothetical protein